MFPGCGRWPYPGYAENGPVHFSRDIPSHLFGDDGSVYDWACT